MHYECFICLLINTELPKHNCPFTKPLPDMSIVRSYIKNCNYALVRLVWLSWVDSSRSVTSPLKQ